VRRRLTFSRWLLDEVRRHAATEAPREACGLLSGDRASGVARAFWPARNVAESPYLYRMDPGELVGLVDGIAAAGEELLAIVHSHPASPAVPSPTDLREAAWPGAWHVVVSLDDRVPPAERVRAWRIGHGAAEEVELGIG
jgi:proteasome lid subunit RPN8/RPN11